MRLKSILPVFVLAAVALANTAAHAEYYNYANGGSYRTPGPYAWSGMYVGMNAAYGIGGDGATTAGQTAANSAEVASGARPASVDVDNSGFVGGVHLGYNWQYNEMVLGLETDLSYSGMDGQKDVFTNGTGGTFGNSYEQDIGYLGTLRARVGYAYDDWLFFATGGLAYGGVKNQVTMYGPSSNLQFTGQDDTTAFGYVIGAGVDYGFDPNWFMSFGYQYFDLGSRDVRAELVSGSGGTATGYNVNFDNSGHLLRVGVTYKWMDQ